MRWFGRKVLIEIEGWSLPLFQKAEPNSLSIEENIKSNNIALQSYLLPKLVNMSKITQITIADFTGRYANPFFLRIQRADIKLRSMRNASA